MEKDNIDRILSAAKVLIAQRGFHGVTVKEIAEHARVAAGTVMLNFKTKTNLLFILCRNFLENLNQASWQAAQKAGTPLQALDAVVDVFAENLRANRLDCLVYSRADPYFNLDLNKFPEAEIKVQKDRYVRLLSLCIDDGVKKMIFRDVDPEQYALLLIAVFTGVMRIAAYNEAYCSVADHLKGFVRSALGVAEAGIVQSGFDEIRQMRED